jgi:nucleotide-binding universal stress UspA family protein
LTLDNWLESLQARLTTLVQSIEIVSERDVHKSLLAAAKKHSPSFVVLFNHRPGLQDDHKKAICQLNVPFLMLREQPWAKTVKVLAAIDPLHEHDDKPIFDVSVVEQASRWARKLAGSVEVLHACFVPPYISEYKAQIRRIHNDAVNNFMTDYGFNQLEYAVQNGGAATVIQHYSKEHAIDLVVAGSLSRSFFERAVIGSTTEQLLQTMSCDMLLLPKL